jgi:hypothetical protein
MFTDSVGARGRRSSHLAAMLASVVLVAVLAGCDVTAGASGARTTPSGGALERACDGPDGSVSDVGTVGLVLSTSSPMATGTPEVGGLQPYVGSAHVGDIIQVRLPTTNRWNLSTVTEGLTLLSPSAALDTGHGVCFWNFKAASAGDARIDFVGGALCARGQACPAYARLASFVVHVS